MFRLDPMSMFKNAQIGVAFHLWQFGSQVYSSNLLSVPQLLSHADGTIKTPDHFTFTVSSTLAASYSQELVRLLRPFGDLEPTHMDLCEHERSSNSSPIIPRRVTTPRSLSSVVPLLTKFSSHPFRTYHSFGLWW